MSGITYVLMIMVVCLLAFVGWLLRRRGQTGADLIAIERNRQIYQEGWSAEHDAAHTNGELVRAAIVYADSALFGRNTLLKDPEAAWPWDPMWNKTNKHSRQRCLVIAGALIAAEIDRLQAQKLADNEVSETEKADGTCCSRCSSRTG